MSTPKVIRAAQHLLQPVSRIAHAFAKRLMGGFLRGWLVIGRRPSQAGFVLPTTILLLLVVTLTVGAIGYRTFTRTQQAIGERQQRVIYNAATPAIDRAKAKIEFLFDPDRDQRSGGVPSQTQLLGMMLNDNRDLGSGIRVPANLQGGNDPYTLPGEQRIDINGDGAKDNAWRYSADLDGDGATGGENDGTVIYSVIFTAPNNDATLRSNNVAARANALQIRNAPLSNATQSTNVCQLRAGTGSDRVVPPINSDGWFPDEINTTKLRKNFQVDAYVLPRNANGTVATLEFQQDREATQGFKWAAWFRNDLEIFPGASFNWNGAMHTEGNLIVGDSSLFRGYLISAPNSCLYDEEASKITAADIAADQTNEIPAFRGQFITGSMKRNDYAGTPKFDLFTTVGRPPTGNELGREMGSNDDSIAPTNSRKPADYALDPVRIQADGVSVGRTVRDPGVNKAPAWDANPLKKRMVFAKEDTPYVDDFFRADNRFGPYPRFGRLREKLPANVNIGDPITGKPELTGNDPPPGSDSTSVGLDGYWERRARREGLRLVVGQRLDLGDPAGWGGPSPGGAPNFDNEPLLPWSGCPDNVLNRCNEARQRKSLWDNLSSVQATAVYHTQSPNGVDYPAACIATTVHPGTAGTLDKSATFENLAYGLPPTAFLPPAVVTTQENYLGTGNRSLIVSDFLRGRGTNGWEYAVPPPSAFSDVTTNNPWMNAMRNLAQFAGDRNGGAPSFTPVQGIVGEDVVHPFPAMAMWGDFSMLRRVIALMDSGVAYDNPAPGASSLSPADKTTLHTAGCLVGMLAYNIDYLEKLNLNAIDPVVAPTVDNENLLGYPNADDPTKPNFAKGLRGKLRLILRRNDPAVLGAPGLAGKRLPESIRVTGATSLLDYATLQKMVFDPNKSQDPETFVRLLERWRDDSSTPAAQRDEFDRQIYLAQLIISKEQVARDRMFGFSPALSLPTSPLGQCGDWSAAVNLATQPPNNGNANGFEIRLANVEPLASLCSRRPHYPILYSLFPASIPTGANPAIPADLTAGYSGGFLDHKEATERAGKTRQSTSDYINTINSDANIRYRVVRPELVASLPLGLAGTTLGSSATAWTLPAVSQTTLASTPNSNRFSLIKVCLNNAPCSQPANPTAALPQNRVPKTGTLYRVPFKDAAFYNGRELMSIRALDLDLDLMRSRAAWNDFWLPKSGLVYAFREDAVSEAHIVRPTQGTWQDCRTDLALRTTLACQMSTSVAANDPTAADPPVSSDHRITPKPVDYYADPDRRPYGFRLRNGASLSRAGDDGRGLSFVSHNPAYVMGSFNLHRSFGTTSESRSDGLEEFSDARLADDFSNFYTRSTLDLTFARPELDQWRPSEVLADAVTPLSTNFCDGSIEDSVYSIGQTGNNPLLTNQVTTRYGCLSSNSNTLTSYLNQPRPSSLAAAPSLKGVRWRRSTLADSYPESLPTSAGNNPAEGESPILFSSTGNPVLSSGDPYEGSYYALRDDKPRIKAPNGIQMNMIMISGLVPSRAKQSYGGLHNFPRFIEDWREQNLYISGAFLQLNFSTYATAPFDQDRFEVSQEADGLDSEDIPYYLPPGRRWGYDVGLQYAKAGPVAERFKFAEAIRSEFYSEPAANDPYIAKLRTCAQAGSCGS